MSSDAPPPPPVELTKEADSEFDARIDDLCNRLAVLEANREMQALGQEADYRNLLIAEIRQRMFVRVSAVWIAVVVMFTMAVFAGLSIFRGSIPPLSGMPSYVAVGLFVAPIFSISAITIMLLVGAFRRFKDDDVPNVDIKALTSEAVKQVSGG